MNDHHRSLKEYDDNSPSAWQKINRILFTADILRPFASSVHRWESATWKNIRWLKHLIGWQILKATELPQSTIAWEEGGFDASYFYKSMGLNVGYDTWASIFYSNELPENAEEQIAELYTNACVIGCEIPDVVQSILTKHHIPFIDIVSHPVRFMEDLLFAFRTNDARVQAKLLKYQINLQDYCLPRANLLRAKAAWMPTLPIPPNSALITGQVATDKALICRKSGRFLSLSDFVEKLFEICEKHSLVLFKPHPYQDINCPSSRTIAAFGAIRTITNNFYHILLQDGLTDVYAINSGTTFEAPYFDKRGHTLGEPLYTFSDETSTHHHIGTCVPIGHVFLEPKFWADVLEPLMPVQNQLPSGPPLRDSLLRRTLNADWDFSFIDEVVQRCTPVGAK